MLAAYARWGDGQGATRTLEAIRRDYGEWPHLQLRPGSRQSDAAFYPRQAAHVLWGLALYVFADAGS